MIIHYTIHDDGYRYPLPSKTAAEWGSSHGLEFVAEEAASDFHSEHDGWESAWPVTITLYDGKEGPELGRFTVEREYDPSFSARPAANGTGGRDA